jgi:hypothetical protein
MRVSPETGKDVRWHEGMNAAPRRVQANEAGSAPTTAPAGEARERGLTLAELKDREPSSTSSRR